MYPDEPVTKLRLEVNGSEDEDEGPVLWKLDWDDTTALSWEALPSTGLAYPGDPINVSTLAVGIFPSIPTRFAF